MVVMTMKVESPPRWTWEYAMLPFVLLLPIPIVPLAIHDGDATPYVLLLALMLTIVVGRPLDWRRFTRRNRLIADEERLLVVRDGKTTDWAVADVKAAAWTQGSWTRLGPYSTDTLVAFIDRDGQFVEAHLRIPWRSMRTRTRRQLETILTEATWHEPDWVRTEWRETGSMGGTPWR